MAKRERTVKLDSEEAEEAGKLVSKGWIKAWLVFEVQAALKETAKESLAKHLENMRKNSSDVKLISKKLSQIDELPAPEELKQHGVEKLFSQVAEIVVMTRGFEALVNLMINYGPSVVEILEPKEIKLSMRDAQNSLVSIADMMHRFASAGIGGMVISS